jgi:metallophosphoesterase superfamily enzyme
VGGVMIMSTTFAITTFIELLVSTLLIYGFMHEDKVIAFEQAVKRIVLGHIRRAIRISHQRKVVKLNEQIRKSNQNVA